MKCEGNELEIMGIIRPAGPRVADLNPHKMLVNTTSVEGADATQARRQISFNGQASRSF